MRLIKKLLCKLIGHEKSHIKLAYSMNAFATSIQVKVFEVSICSRCGSLFVNRIDWYERYNWYSTRLAEEEEKGLREIGAVTLAEAYEELVVNET
ncbi:hypothetical protein [Mitsuokella multacida]|uniref:hypothetical protein n=1 Tax=Mitsuokella multacida TaxID=52226 RepID=UPI00242FB8DC|nr:hypothetical protein [Mitsuokella multacida]